MEQIPADLTTVAVTDAASAASTTKRPAAQECDDAANRGGVSRWSPTTRAFVGDASPFAVATELFGT
jgi:hypothetical protein